MRSYFLFANVIVVLCFSLVHSGMKKPRPNINLPKELFRLQTCQVRDTSDVIEERECSDDKLTCTEVVTLEKPLGTAAYFISYCLEEGDSLNFKLYEVGLQPDLLAVLLELQLYIFQKSMSLTGCLNNKAKYNCAGECDGPYFIEGRDDPKELSFCLKEDQNQLNLSNFDRKFKPKPKDEL